MAECCNGREVTFAGVPSGNRGVMFISVSVLDQPIFHIGCSLLGTSSASRVIYHRAVCSVRQETLMSDRITVLLTNRPHW